MSIQVYGWNKDKSDTRDFKFGAIYEVTGSYPNVVDNRSTDWGIYNQGQLGSCTANSSLSAYRNLLLREKKIDIELSRLAQYYWSRLSEGSTATDNGAEIRDAIKVLASTGAALESLWPYDIEKFTIEPSTEASHSASQHICVQYLSVNQTKDDICTAINKNGNLVIGITVYNSFEGIDCAKTGVIPIPDTTKEQALGGHAIELIGYDLDKNHVIFKNSWGADWGDKGYGYLPFDYILNNNLASDFWTLEVVD